MSDQTAQSSYVDSYSSNSSNNQPPTDDIAGFKEVDNSQAVDQKQKLEEQNIFTLLGVKNGSDEDKEKFLDELQQVIWDDFLKNDVELLVTTEEMKKVEEIKAKQGVSSIDLQEELVGFLENLIPDLEELMLEKALELKEKMFKQRVLGIKEFYSDQQDKLEKVARAEELVGQDQWGSALQALDNI